MKRSVWALGLLVGLGALSLSAQPAASTPDWSAWKFVMGDWIADGSGAAGEGTGGFTLAPALGGQVLIRHSHAEYPATKERPAVNHVDLLVIYQEAGSTKGSYWDNEGHFIAYEASAGPDGSIALVSPVSQGAPRFRFVYEPLPDGRVGMRFEIAPPGKPDAFQTYTKGTAHRK
jgi:hypothetical protein